MRHAVTVAFPYGRLARNHVHDSVRWRNTGAMFSMRGWVERGTPIARLLRTSEAVGACSRRDYAWGD
ncbi:MAG: hypothetical protein C4346_04180 [Chloroflexota bacterium]